MDDYEDFAQFCQNEAGEIDIDKWSFDYVKQVILVYIQLIKKYHTDKAKENEQQQHERSFANYQTADIQQAYSIVAAVQNSQHSHSEQMQTKNNPQQPAVEPEKKRSAFDLLDSVFEDDNSSNSSSSPGSNSSPPLKHS